MSETGKVAVSSKDAPGAIGPYSQAVRVGNTLFCSGQVGRSADGKMGTTIQEQTKQALENLKHVLGAAGLDVVHVVKTTVFLKDLNDFAAMNEIYAQYLAPKGVVAPARSTVQVARLPVDALVEIEAIAMESTTS